MSTPFWDVDATVSEVERGIDAGHRGVLFTGEPQRFGLPYLGERHWDPLWAIAQEAGLPIHFHIGSGDMDASFTPERIAAHGTAATYAYTSAELFLRNGVQCADLITCGRAAALPRPPVRVGRERHRLDAVRARGRRLQLPRRRAPAARASGSCCRRSTSPGRCTLLLVRDGRADASLLDEIPVDNMLFETDFPHPTCLYGNMHEKIEASLAGATDEQRRRILWENAAELYRVDEPSVSPTAS